jgi:cell division cycle protein 20 (cofactor of APC complex)
VSAVHWSTAHKELISGHCYPNKNLIIWEYPSMGMVTGLRGHEGRILQLAISPDGSPVSSVSADETLKVWGCFTPTSTKNKETTDFESISTCYKLIT